MNSQLIRQLASLSISSIISLVAVDTSLANAEMQKTKPSQKHLAPLPPEKEWWITATVEGHLVPVLTDPWWDRISATVVRDRATDLWWKNPASLPLHAPLSLQRAQKVCEENGVMRLPTRHELESIIDRYRSTPVVDSTIFPELVSDFYWTLTPSSSRSNWVVHLDDGRFVKRSTDENSQARAFCVSDMRADAPPMHYTVTAKTIRDNATGLLWHSALTAADDFQSLADACAASAIMNIQWRVPTSKELLSIMSPERAEPYIDPIFKDTREVASSTSTGGAGGIQFQGVSYRTGTRLPMEGTLTRCVSNGEPHLANTKRIFKGNVEILGGYENGNLELQKFEARQLRSIEGNILVQDLKSAALVLPYIETIKGDLTITRTLLNEIHLPNLTEVTGTITIDDNGTLDKISMRSLASVAGDIVISRNAKLGILQPDGDSGTIGGPVRMDSLWNVGGAMKIEYNEQIKTLYWPALQKIGHQFFITQNSSLWWLQANSLVSIGSNCKTTGDFCGSFDVSFNTKLQALSLNFLEKVSSNISFQGNSVLNEFANRLNTIGRLYVEFNKSLCARDRIDPILYRMRSKGQFPAAVRINNNNPGEECRTACPNLELANCSIQQ
jgi:hypothetical protein